MRERGEEGGVSSRESREQAHSDPFGYKGHPSSIALKVRERQLGRLGLLEGSNLHLGGPASGREQARGVADQLGAAQYGGRISLRQLTKEQHCRIKGSAKVNAENRPRATHIQ